MDARTALAISAPACLVVLAQGLVLATADACSGDPTGATTVLPVLVGVFAALQTTALGLAGASARVVAASALLGLALLGGSIVLYGFASVAPLGCGPWELGL
jgi:hypothetical protein